MKSPPKAILFSGILYADPQYLIRAEDALVDRFGPLRYKSPEIPWHSGHYEDELGSPINRRFLFFDNTITQDALRDIKLATCSMERDLSVEGRRKVNLDPGILAPARVVLATTKDYAHRIYLGDGIFAETTLIYRHGRFSSGGFAYSDYLEDEVLELFALMRQELLSANGG